MSLSNDPREAKLQQLIDDAPKALTPNGIFGKASKTYG